MSNETSPYGVTVHLPFDRLVLLERCRAAGIAWVRVDFNWNLLEPNRGKFNWAPAERVIEKARELGLNVFATLAYTPKWANGDKEYQYPAANAADWAAFVTNVVRRFGASVKHWGMWNEPNLTEFFKGTLDEYIKNVLVAGANAAKAADPTCKVLGPDLSAQASKEAPDRNWDKWLPAILKNPAANAAIDILTHHIYGWPKKSYSFLPWTTMEGKVFSELDGRPWPWDKWSASVKSIMQQCDALQKEVWLTETGCEWKDYGSSLAAAASGQSKAYETFLTCLSKRKWIKKVFFYDLLDAPQSNMFFGFLNEDPGFTPRAHFETYTRWIQSHPC